MEYVPVNQLSFWSDSNPWWDTVSGIPEYPAIEIRANKIINNKNFGFILTSEKRF